MIGHPKGGIITSNVPNNMCCCVDLILVLRMSKNYPSASPSVHSNDTSVERRLRLVIRVARNSRSVKPDSFPPSSITGLTQMLCFIFSECFRFSENSRKNKTN